MRLIDADKLKESIQQSITKCDINRDCYDCGYSCIEKLDYDDIEKIIDEQSTVEMPNIKLLQDGTLIVNTDLYFEVNRVLVEHETNGTLYYSDGDERPKGEWVEPDGSYDKKIWRKCSNCGKHVKKFEIINYSSYENKINFCQNCGAEMEIGE